MKYSRAERTEKPPPKSPPKLSVSGVNSNGMQPAGAAPDMMGPVADNNTSEHMDNNGGEVDYEKFQQGMLGGEIRIRNVPFPKGSRGKWSHDEENYSNNSYWQVVAKGRELQIREGVKPSEALNDILNNPGNYAMDCGYFQQTIILAGMLNSMGNDGFDEFITSQGEKFTLRNHLSTGIKASDEVYDNINGKWFAIKAYKELSGFDPEKFIKNAEIGTQLTIKAIPLANTVFANENIVKVGDDSFIAQGLGPGPISIKEIKDELGKKAVEYGVIQQAQLTNKWIKENIYIRQIIVPSFTVAR